MKAIKFLSNIIVYFSMPALLTLLLSFLFCFKYINAVQSIPFAVIYFVYCIVMVCILVEACLNEDKTVQSIRIF